MTSDPRELPSRDAAPTILPESFPPWPGLVLGAALAIALPLIAQRVHLPQLLADCMDWRVSWVHGLAICVLLPVWGNCRRLRRRQLAMPGPIQADTPLPEWLRASIASGTNALDNTTLHQLGDLHNSIDQKELEFRGTLRAQHTLVQLGPLLMVALALPVGILTQGELASTRERLMPLLVASIEAAMLVLPLAVMMNRSNALLRGWNSAARILVATWESSALRHPAEEVSDDIRLGQLPPLRGELDMPEVDDDPFPMPAFPAQRPQVGTTRAAVKPPEKVSNSPPPQQPTAPLRGPGVPLKTVSNEPELGKQDDDYGI